MKQTSSSNILKFYNCPITLPGAAITFLLKANHIQYQEILIDIFKDEQKTEEFKKINPLQKIPAITDGDFNLFESATILRYLCNSRQLDDFWYPKDSKKRALVDLYFDWFAANFRSLTTFIEVKFGWPTMSFEEAKTLSEKASKELENVFLTQRKYLASNEKITIADLAFLPILASMILLDIELTPRLQEYYKNVTELAEVKENFKAYFQVLQDAITKKLVFKSENKQASYTGNIPMASTDFTLY